MPANIYRSSALVHLDSKCVDDETAGLFSIELPRDVSYRLQKLTTSDIHGVRLHVGPHTLDVKKVRLPARYE